MRAVEVRATAADFAATLSSMREWLDRNNCNIVRFEHAPERPGTVLIRAEFDTQGMAEAFRQEFGERSAPLLGGPGAEPV